MIVCDEITAKSKLSNTRKAIPSAVHGFNAKGNRNQGIIFDGVNGFSIR